MLNWLSGFFTATFLPWLKELMYSVLPDFLKKFGFAAVSSVAIIALIRSIGQIIAGYFGQLTESLYALLAISGIIEGMGIIIGALIVVHSKGIVNK